ncbi:hypothetical protein CR513_23122, partial [Mucuna pruriens]
MLRTVGVAKSLWAEAVKTTCFVINRSLSDLECAKRQAHQCRCEKKNELITLLHKCLDVLTKLNPKSRKCIFLGYADNVKGYRLWDPTAHKVIVSRNVVFAENELQNE